MRWSLWFARCNWDENYSPSYSERQARRHANLTRCAARLIPGGRLTSTVALEGSGLGLAAARVVALARGTLAGEALVLAEVLIEGAEGIRLPPEVGQASGAQAGALA